MIECKIGFIGAGNMTQAIVTGMLESGIIKPDLIMASAPSKTNFPFWQEKEIFVTHSNAEVVNKCDVIMLGMKPQYLDEAIKSFDPVPNNKLYISILAGITIETLNDKLRTHFNYTEAGPEPWRIVRVIPNTPIMVGAGATAYAVSEGVTPEDSQLVKTIFSAGGLCESVPERLLNPVGALSGSGPAYTTVVSGFGGEEVSHVPEDDVFARSNQTLQTPPSSDLSLLGKRKRKRKRARKGKRQGGPSHPATGGDFQGVPPMRSDPGKMQERVDHPKRPRHWDAPPPTSGPSGAPGSATSSRLAFTPVDYPDVRFTDEDCRLLQEKLLALVFEDDAPAKLQILKTIQVRGALVAVCGNDETNAWVKKVACSLVIREGVAVVVGDYKDLLHTTKVLLQLEDLLAKVDPKKILAQLQKQNGISTEDWCIIDVRREEGVQTLILGIDDKSAMALRDRCWQVCVGITKVFFRVLSGGPTVTKPPDVQVSASEPATQ